MMMPSERPLDITSAAIDHLLLSACDDAQLAASVVTALVNRVSDPEHHPESFSWDAERVAALENALFATNHISHEPLLAFCLVFVSHFAPAHRARFIDRGLKVRTTCARAVALAIEHDFPGATELAGAALDEKSTVALRLTIRALVEWKPEELPRLAGKILRHARSRNRAVRVQVARACAELQSAEVVPVLKQLFSDPEASVRVAALTGLVTSASDADVYVSLALRDPSSWLRRVAVKVALEFKIAVNPQDVEPLLQDSEWSLRRDGFMLLYQADPALALTLIDRAEFDPQVKKALLEDLGVVSTAGEIQAQAVAADGVTEESEMASRLRMFYADDLGATLSDDLQRAIEGGWPEELLRDLVSFVFLGRLANAALSGNDAEVAMAEFERLRRGLLTARDGPTALAFLDELKKAVGVPLDSHKWKSRFKRLIERTKRRPATTRWFEAFCIGFVVSGVSDDSHFDDEAFATAPAFDPREVLNQATIRSDLFDDHAFTELVSVWMRKKESNLAIEQAPSTPIWLPLEPMLTQWAWLRASPVCLGFLTLDFGVSGQMTWPWLTLTEPPELAEGSKSLLTACGRESDALLIQQRLAALAQSPQPPAWVVQAREGALAVPLAVGGGVVT